VRQIFDFERLCEELLGTGPHRTEDQIAIRRGAGDQDRAGGRRFRERRHELERFVRVTVEPDEADIGVRLREDVAKELVARALGFEPNAVETEDRSFQRVAR
jgi:hypothetical protein